MIQPIRPNEASRVYQRQVSAGEPATEAARGDGGRSGRGGRRADRVTISDQAQMLSRVLDAVRSIPDVREERVAAIRAQLADGSYDADAVAIAERLIDEGAMQ